MIKQEKFGAQHQNKLFFSPTHCFKLSL